MNLSRQILESNSSDHSFLNGTWVQFNSKHGLIAHLITILCGVPINSYVIWLIVTGTGNGLAAEIFSLNLSVCELLFSLESVLILVNHKYTYHFFWLAVYFLDGLVVTCRPLFQCLICVERYLAVVHPVTFLKYKPLRYRVICSVIVWPASFVFGGISIMSYILFLFMLYLVFLCAHFFFFLTPQLFFCVAVLRALKQSGPGERDEENHMKRKAFYLILVSNLSMIALYVPYISSLLVFTMSAQKPELLILSGFVCFVLAGLMQPFFFLYRVGKISFMKCQ